MVKPTKTPLNEYFRNYFSTNFKKYREEKMKKPTSVVELKRLIDDKCTLKEVSELSSSSSINSYIKQGKYPSLKPQYSIAFAQAFDIKVDDLDIRFKLNDILKPIFKKEKEKVESGMTDSVYYYFSQHVNSSPYIIYLDFFMYYYFAKMIRTFITKNNINTYELNKLINEKLGRSERNVAFYQNLQGRSLPNDDLLTILCSIFNVEKKDLDIRYCSSYAELLERIEILNEGK